MRCETAPWMLPAIARASTVFAVPGTSSKRTWPPQASAASTMRISSRLPWTTVSVFASSRPAISPARARAASAGSVCGALTPGSYGSRRGLWYLFAAVRVGVRWAALVAVAATGVFVALQGAALSATAAPRWIVFAARLGGADPSQLYRIQTDGKGLQKITEGADPATQP